MAFEFFHPISEVDESFMSIKTLYEVVDGVFVYRGVTLVSACFDMSAMFGCQALIVVFTNFALGCEVDQCFICVKKLFELLDGTFVYRRATLVSACVSCY